MDIRQKVVNDITKKFAIEVEDFMRTRIKPKPKYLPTFIWYYLLKKLFVLEIQK